MANNSSLQQINHSYCISELVRYGAIKDADQRTLEKIPNPTTGLVLAVRSSGFFNDQEILRWIRKGKTISKEQQAIWQKMGKGLSRLFVVQFELYDDLYSYLKREIPSEEVEEWKRILNTCRYIWPMGTDKGWENIFNPVPRLCEKVTTLTTNLSTPDLNKRKHEEQDNSNTSKRQKVQPVPGDESKTGDTTPIEGKNLGRDKEDGKKGYESSFAKETIHEAESSGTTVLTEKFEKGDLSVKTTKVSTIILASSTDKERKDERVNKTEEKSDFVPEDESKAGDTTLIEGRNLGRDKEYGKKGLESNFAKETMHEAERSGTTVLTEKYEQGDLSVQTTKVSTIILASSTDKETKDEGVKKTEEKNIFDSPNIRNSELEVYNEERNKDCDENVESSKNLLDSKVKEKEIIAEIVDINSNVFNKDFFIKQLKEAKAIKAETEKNDDEKFLIKVPNITVGLVMAAIATGWYSNLDIIKWIRKGRRVTPQLEEQFKFYKKLSIYLDNNSNQLKELEWIKILYETKYNWPVNTDDHWTNLFGYIPTICNSIDIDSVLNIETCVPDINPSEVSSDESKGLTKPNQDCTLSDVIEKSIAPEQHLKNPSKSEGEADKSEMNSVESENNVLKKTSESNENPSGTSDNSDEVPAEDTEEKNENIFKLDITGSGNNGKETGQMPSELGVKKSFGDTLKAKLKLATAQLQSSKNTGLTVLASASKNLNDTGEYGGSAIIIADNKKVEKYLKVSPTKKQNARFGASNENHQRLQSIVELSKASKETTVLDDKEKEECFSSKESSQLVHEENFYIKKTTELSLKHTACITVDSKKMAKSGNNSEKITNVRNDDQIELKEIDPENSNLNYYFSQKYHETVLEKAGAIDPNGKLLKVSSYSVGLVLAAKSLGTVGDIDIMKWIRTGKKIEYSRAQEWKKMGKKLTQMFNDQFKNYKKMSYYLMENIEAEDIQTWKKILCENEYIWPVGLNEGWSNIFEEIPDLCFKIDMNMSDNPNEIKRKAMCIAEASANENVDDKESSLHEERGKGRIEYTPISVRTDIIDESMSEHEVGSVKNTDIYETNKIGSNESVTDKGIDSDKSNVSPQKSSRLISDNVELVLASSTDENSCIDSGNMNVAPSSTKVTSDVSEDFLSKEYNLSENESNKSVSEHSKLKEVVSENESNNTDSVLSKLKDAPGDKFTLEYFILKLEKAGSIRSKPGSEGLKDLVKVTNISIGLVLAAISTGSFADTDIVKWIRKGRKLNHLLEKQFKCYKQLSVYLMKGMNKVNLHEWEKLLDDTKYVWPVEGSAGWQIIFGEIPEICHGLDFDHLESMSETKDLSGDIVDTTIDNERKKNFDRSSFDTNSLQISNDSNDKEIEVKTDENDQIIKNSAKSLQTSNPEDIGTNVLATVDKSTEFTLSSKYDTSISGTNINIDKDQSVTNEAMRSNISSLEKMTSK